MSPPPTLEASRTSPFHSQRYIAVTWPLHGRYKAWIRLRFIPNVTLPLHCRCIAVTLPLQGLEYVYANDNQLAGPIPHGLGYLRRLRSLRLENNKVDGTTPDTWNGMHYLQHSMVT